MYWKIGIFVVAVLALAGVGWYSWSQKSTQGDIGLANPASVNCTKTLGGSLEIADEGNGQVGYCHLPDGRVCEEWALFRDNTCSTSPEQATSTSANSGNNSTGDGSAGTTLGQSVTIQGLMITPKEVLEDSRCPKDVQCIQAGRVRIQTVIVSEGKATTTEMTLGEPVLISGAQVTLTVVAPDKISKVAIKPGEYRFTFIVKKGVAITYKNASADKIVIDTPTPGAVTGKTFSIKGKARGNWYSEAVFPVLVLDMSGKTLTQVQAHADGEWMTEALSPWTANVTVPDSYTGAATIVVTNDNPSGDPSRDASASFPITIEY